MIDTISFQVVNVRQRYGQMVGLLNSRNNEKGFKVLRLKDNTRAIELDIKKGSLYIPSSSRMVNYT